MKISPARRIAFDVLLRVETEQAFASDLLHEALQEGVSRADAALATEISMGVLRRQRELDFHIAAHCKTPLTKLDREVLIALRLATYQLWHLDRVPPHAAINESVNLVKAARKSSAAPMVNAVLRKLATARKHGIRDLASAGRPLAGAGTPSAKTEQIATMHSHPTWLVERWLAAWGEARTIELLESNNRAPRLTIAVHDSAQRDAIVAELRAAGLRVDPGRWLRDALAVNGGSVTHAAAWRASRISIQDEASQMVARLLDVQPGDAVLDACAAPGGKTLTLARAAGAKSHIVAGDFHWHRLHAMQQRLRAAGAGHVRMVALNAAAPLPFSAETKFHRILVDAPCSGTGTLARNPEIRWRLRPEDIAALCALQRDILTHALRALAPGGRLVYSTCSLEPEENEAVIAAVLAERTGVRLVSGFAALAPHLADSTKAAGLFDAHGYFRTFPPAHGTDGFFAAVLNLES